MIETLSRLFRDDPDGWTITHLHEPNKDGSGDVYYPLGRCFLNHNKSGVHLIVATAPKLRIWVNSIPLGWFDRRAIYRAIKEHWAKKMTDHLQGRSHPDVALLTAPRD